MSYYYGSDSPQIQNPFKNEGCLFILSGAIISVIGLISLFTLRSQILNRGIASRWINLIICLLLLGAGIGYISNGLYKIFRFYVGRGIPASLAKNLAKSEMHVNEQEVVYKSEDFEQMLMGRKNPTFVEPDTFLDRLVYSIYSKFIFLPYAMRNYLHILAAKTAYSVMAVTVYLLSLLSGSLGLTKITESSFGDWMGIILIIILLFVWTNNNISVKRLNKLKIESLNVNFFRIFVVLAVLLPAIGECILRRGAAIPKAPLNPTLHILLFVILILISLASGVILAQKRAEMLNPLTEVSEYRDHWQENVHPKDIFRSFDMEMANLRYKEIPNRVYREMNPHLNMEGSFDKGSFNGDTIQETQPIYEDIEHTDIFKKIRLCVSIYGHILVCFSALLLFLLNYNVPESISVGLLFNAFYIPVLLWTFGNISVNVAHIYWAEINFKSYLMHFQGEGTYTESKISVGMAITDSTRSENQIVRSSFTPWFIVSEIKTSTLAGSGSKNLEGARYVLDIRKADNILGGLVKGIRDFLEGRQIIANSISDKDLNSVKDLYTLNQASPSNIGVKAINLMLGDNKEQDKLDT